MTPYRTAVGTSLAWHDMIANELRRQSAPRHLPAPSWPRSTVALLSAAVLLGSVGCDGSPTTPPSPGGSLDEGRIEQWTTASPSSRGVDPDVLAELETRISSGEFGTISSLLVVRGGDLVYERYWGTWTAQDLHPVYSVSKSVTSLLVGIARGDGALPDLDRPLLDLFPQYVPFANPTGKEAITFRHVLTMRTGLEWDELSTNYSESVNPTVALAASDDWLKYVLDLPLADAPGSRFTYNSGVSMLMAGALERELGESAKAFAARRLFAPLGITGWAWDEGPHGLTNSGWGLRLRPRDMATIGQMVLQSGDWQGSPVVPSEWIEESAGAATRFVDGTGYGYQWWLGPDDGGGRPIAAWGYGGQFIVAIPSLDLLVVSTAENFAGGGFTPYTLADVLYRAVSGCSGVGC